MITVLLFSLIRSTIDQSLISFDVLQFLLFAKLLLVNARAFIAIILDLSYSHGIFSTNKIAPNKKRVEFTTAINFDSLFRWHFF